MSLRVAVLLSGGGTTLENLYEQHEGGVIDIDIAMVIATKDSAYGLVRAQNHNTPTAVIKPCDFEGPESFSQALNDVLDPLGVELIVLAGFMFLYIVPPQYAGKVMNVHPALIPAFCGKGYYGHHVHEAVIDRGAKVSGCTVHFVDNVYDNGPIILQKTVTVENEDNPDTLAEKVQAAEREAYPEAIRLFAEGRLEIKGRRVFIR